LNEFEEAAHTIIDLVEMAIRKAHPEIEKYASKLDENTLLHGEAYYNLEAKIAKILKDTSYEKYLEKRHKEALMRKSKEKLVNIIIQLEEAIEDLGGDLEQISYD